MEKLISMQDIRTSLASVANRAENGESFIVVRNSKPAFRIVPLKEKTTYPKVEDEKPLTFKEIQERFQSSGASEMITEEDLDEIIHEVHRVQNNRLKR
ncbi:MAG: type II toxin-antitoxin system prevent-host-death family antitoxin [Kiritimatiellales bacterium]|nr:type II toxin-antitoxin system prevent-host-death family antitoxin [Kiritimatiellales bacterium]